MPEGVAAGGGGLLEAEPEPPPAKTTIIKAETQTVVVTVTVTGAGFTPILVQASVHGNRQRAQGLRPADAWNAALHGEGNCNRRRTGGRSRTSSTPAATRSSGEDEQRHTEQPGH